MIYNFNKWDAKLIQDPIELMKELNGFNIKHKQIKSIIIIGHVFDLEDIIDPYDLEGNMVVFDDDEYIRCVQIDAPFIIEFDDGDRLELDYSEGSSIKVGLNTLPKNIKGHIEENVDGNIFFSDCIGEEIIGYAVEMEDGPFDWYFTGSCGTELDWNKDLYISKLRILLTDHFSLEFTNFHDYGEVALLKYNFETKITRREIMLSLINNKEK